MGLTVPILDIRRRNILKILDGKFFVIHRTLLILVVIFGILLSALPVYSQEILTAEKYFETLSNRYGKIQDYETKIVITKGEVVMKGTLYYKTPNLLRIDFTQPKDQVIVTDGKELTIYIPKYEVIMKQKLRKHSEAAIASMVSKQGLIFLKRNYGIAYLVGPDPVPIDAGSKERVVKLKLTSRSTLEGFRQIILSVGDDGLIRRIKGVTVGYDEIVFDFLDRRINQNIPDSKFDYDAPAYANVFNNFLFEAEE